MGVVPDRLPGYESLDNPLSQQRLQDLWGKKFPSAGGLSVERLLGAVSGLIVVADDPVSVLPMGERAMAAMRAIEFLVVLDAFKTPAVGIAHAQLPVASFAETDGTITNMEGRVQRLRAATNAPGDAMHGWSVLAELCSRFDVSGSYSSAFDVLREIGQAAPRYAGMERLLSAGALLGDLDGAKFVVRSSRVAEMPAPTALEHPYLLALDGAFNWGDDPLVSFSPTLRRDYRSERRLFPAGVVEMGQSDADALKLRPGRPARLSSVHGEAIVTVRVRADIHPGVLFVPYAFRKHVSNVLGTDGVAAIKVECA